MDYFYPILTSIVGNGNQEWILLDEIEGGECAKIYNVYCMGEIYILKYMEFNGQDSGILPIVTREIKIQVRCAKLGIAPKIIAAWICNKGSVMIMKKIKYLLSDVLRVPNSENRKKIKIVQKCLILLQIMHHHGMCHRDPHPENFMLDENKIYLIDFGASEYIKPYENGVKRADYKIFASCIQSYLPEWKDVMSVVLTKEEIDRINRKK